MIAKKIYKNSTVRLFITLLVTFISNNAFSQKLTAQFSAATATKKGSSCVIQLNVIQSNIDGFMKFSQVLPTGYSASELDSKGGDFRFENNEIKIIWLKAPSQKAYTISYKLTIPANAAGYVSLGGAITYVSPSNERKAYTIPAKEITFLTDNNVPKKTNAAKAVKEAAAKENNPDNDKPETNTQQTSTATKPNNTASVTNPNAPEFRLCMKYATGIYTIQVGAFRKKPQLSGIPEPFIISKQELNRYYSGKFNSYRDALARKKLMIEYGYKDAYIVILQPGDTPASGYTNKAWQQAVTW